jgi:osmotically inducible protein OsmC
MCCSHNKVKEKKMPIRRGEASWRGRLRDGQGHIRLGSGAFEGSYSFASRFENGPGTNPDELVAAAEAGCFSMALALTLEEAGYTLEYVHTGAILHLDKQEHGFKITRIELETEAKVAEIEFNQFKQLAEQTKQTCPVSQALKGVELILSAKLI